MIETDAPWCEIKRTHPSFKYVQTQFPCVKKEKFEIGKCVKSRYEPCHIVQVLEVIAGHLGLDINEVGEACYANTMKVFFPNES